MAAFVARSFDPIGVWFPCVVSADNSERPFCCNIKHALLISALVISIQFVKWVKGGILQNTYSRCWYRCSPKKSLVVHVHWMEEGMKKGIEGLFPCKSSHRLTKLCLGSELSIWQHVSPSEKNRDLAAV